MLKYVTIFTLRELLASQLNLEKTSCTREKCWIFIHMGKLVFVMHDICKLYWRHYRRITLMVFEQVRVQWCEFGRIKTDNLRDLGQPRILHPTRFAPLAFVSVTLSSYDTAWHCNLNQDQGIFRSDLSYTFRGSTSSSIERIEVIIVAIKGLLM